MNLTRPYQIVQWPN